MGRKTAATTTTARARRDRPATTLMHEFLDDGRTKRALSADTRIPEVKLGEIIRGVSRPTDDEKLRIAKALGRPVAKLFPAA